jgi:1-acyl-sn-glycerol-3-phosphate acyltransferase
MLFEKPDDQIGAFRRVIVRPVLKFFIRLAFTLLVRFEVSGKENLPQRGPLIVVANHFNFLDPVVLINVLPYSTEFIGGTEMPNAPALARIFPMLYGILRVHRGSVSREALTNGENMVKKGGVLGIFPEAGSWAQVLRPARPGAALLAVRTGAQIVPLGLDGVENIFPFRLGRRARVRINIGEPFGPFTEDIRGRDGREKLDGIGHSMMEGIKRLIPANKHGYYSDDPNIRLAARGTEIYPWDNITEK